MGVLAAAIFAGQMLNFSVTGGTSGHLLGAALATVLLGPWAAIVVMTTVVSIQALIFQDGGLLALGPNLFNMALVGVSVSYFCMTSCLRIARQRPSSVFVGIGLSGWLSIVIASLACALELAVSGTSPANLAIPAMAGIHMLIGLGEAAITISAIAFLYAARRDLLGIGESGPRSESVVWLGGLALTIVLVILAPLASSNPDGLEWIAARQGFLDSARPALFKVLPEYVVPGIANEALAMILAGIVGALLVLGAVVGAAHLRRISRT
jgi:cobalt/nickel transport system permease protein